VEKETIDCNIIIPTYNRPDYLRRILHYYRNFGSCFDIIVADSSSAENKKINRDTISSLSGINILYLDNYSPSTISHDKFADMVQFAQKKYCVICADDDFIIPNGIKKAIEFLEGNADFTTAHGAYISFFLKNTGESHSQFIWQPIYPYSSIVSDSAKERLIKHFADYCQTMYAVHRTEFLQMIYGELLKSKVDPLLFGELLPDMLTLIYGKMKRLKVLYAARQAFSTHGGNWPSMQDFKKVGKFGKEYEKFRNCLAVNLIKNSGLTQKEANEVVDVGTDTYFKKYYAIPFYKKLRAAILARLPEKVSKKIRLAYQSVRSPESKDESVDTMEDPSSGYYKDFNILRSHIMFYE